MNSIKTNYLYSIGYQILAIIIPFFTIPYLSRIFGAEGVGIFSYTTSISQYFTLFAMLGLNNYGLRAVAVVRDTPNILNRTFSEIWTMQFFFGGLALLCYLLFIFLWGGQFRIYFYILLFQVASSLVDINWLLGGLEQFKTLTMRNAVVKIATIVLIFTLIKNKEDLWLYICLYSFSIFASAIMLWPYAYRKISFIKPTYAGICKHIIPNFVMFIPVVAISIYKYMDKIMLGNSSIEQVGYYENVEKMLTLVLSFITAFGTVMMPRMSHLVANQQIEMAEKYFLQSIDFVMFLSIGMAAGMYSVAEIFIPLFLGKGFEECILIMKIMSISALFSSWANVVRTQYLIPNHKDKVYVISVILGAVINFVGNLILIPKFAAIGVVISTVVAEMVVAITQTLCSYKSLPLKKMCLSSLPYLLVASIMILLISKFNKNIECATYIKLLWDVLVGSVFYLVASFLFKYKKYEHSSFKI